MQKAMIGRRISIAGGNSTHFKPRFSIAMLCFSIACSGQSTEDYLSARIPGIDKSPPALLAPHNGSYTRNPVELLFTPRSGTRFYTIELALSADFSGTVQSLSSPSAAATVELADGVTYYWRVRTDYAVSAAQSFVVLDAVYVSKDTAVGGTRNGRKVAPFAEITDAFALAQETGREIRVAQSTTPYAGSFAVPDGVTLKGGYERHNWTRNINAHPTVIRSSSLVPVTIAYQSQATSISGFIIENSYSENFQDVIALNVEQTSRNTSIEDNIIRLVDPSSTSGFRHAVKCHSQCRARFMRNQIQGGECHKATRAFLINDNSSPELIANTIDAGYGNRPEFALDIGLDNSGAEVVLRNNTILGGTANSVGPYALGVSSGILVADSNLIYGGQTNSGDAVGLYVSVFASVTITNNQILGGAGGGTFNKAYALEIYGSNVIATNNLFIGGPAQDTNNATVKVGIPGALRLSNNLILTDGYFTRQSIREDSSGYAPQSLENNAFWHLSDMGTYYFYKAYSGTCATGCTTVAAFEAKTDWTAGADKGRANYAFADKALPFANYPLMRDVTIANNTGSGNVLKVNNCTPYVAGQYVEWARDGVARQIVSCASGDLTIGTAITPTLNLRGREIRLWGTRSSNYAFDFRYVQAGLSSTEWNTLRFGGLNATLSVCGAPAGGADPGPGGSSCGGVSQDAAGVLRTAQNGTLADNTSGSSSRRDGFSIGPYEVE